MTAHFFLSFLDSTGNFNNIYLRVILKYDAPTHTRTPPPLPPSESKRVALLLLLGLAAKASAYNNGAPFSRMPTLAWSSWVSLGPGAEHPVFDFCDEQSVMAAADAFAE